MANAGEDVEEEGVTANRNANVNSCDVEIAMMLKKLKSEKVREPPPLTEELWTVGGFWKESQVF